jgi:HD-like signal output (HDOD) protein
MLSDIAFNQLDQLPALSPATPKLIELANSITASPKELLDIVKTDPILAGKILALVNSAYFSLPERIYSLNRAIILLGINTIKNIALSSSLVNALGTTEQNQYFNNTELWKHMLAVGITSKILAQKSKINKQEIEHYFIAGLLHDIGDILMIKLYPNEFYNLIAEAKENEFSISELSRDKYNTTANIIGAKASKLWKLPDPLCEVIEFSRKPQKDSSKLTKTVYISDKICRKLEIGFTCDKSDLDISDSDLESLNLQPDDLLSIQELIEVEMEKASVFIE